MPDFDRKVPEGDNRERLVCRDCGFINYENPKIVTGSVVAHEGKVLLCRRAIEPRRDYWTLPAGYMELGETLEEGARREAMEEAQADIVLEGILAIFTISRIGQVQVIYRAHFAGGVPRFGAGPESLEVQLFAWDDIPWETLAFPTVHWSLNAWRRNRSDALGHPEGNPPEDVRGSIRPQHGV